MPRLVQVPTSSSYGSFRSAAKKRSKGYGKLAMPRGIPTLCGRRDGDTYILEIRCRDAAQTARIAERISKEVLGW